MKLRFPKVSVVISTYNRPAMLREAVESVLRQDYDDFECIVVDDGSHTARGALEDLRDAFDERGIRLALVDLDENSGYQAVPKNCGVVKSRGSYIAHFDDDDLMMPHHLSTLVGEMEKGGCELVYGTWVNENHGAEKGPPDGSVWEYIPFNRLTVKLILSDPLNNFVSVATLWSKSAVQTALGSNPWNEMKRRFGDHDLYVRMIQAGLRFRGVPVPTFVYRWHGNNLQVVRPASTVTAKVKATMLNPIGRQTKDLLCAP